LRTALRVRLPEYMVPSAFVTLDSLPLTPNGKVDRKALPAPGQQDRGEARQARTMMTATQRSVADIWAAVLGSGRIGLHDNFFDLGGHSLLVIKVHAAMKRRFDADVTVIDLFQRSTVAAQAELLDAVADRDAGLVRARARIERQVHV